MSAQPTYIYGWGDKKHIASGVVAERSGRRQRRGDPQALCGVFGGYPTEEPERPTCRLCERKWEATQ